MPFISRIIKSSSRRRRPPWQDSRPDSRAQSEMYAIADKNAGKFSRAFAALSRSLFSDPKELAAAENAIRAGNVEEAINAFKFANENDPDAMKDWDKFTAKLEEAYAVIMQESGDDALQGAGIDQRFNMLPEGVESLPPNPFSTRWIKSHSAQLVRLISDESKATIRQVILDGYTEGARVETIMSRLELSGSFGLLPREQKAVQRLGDKMTEAGASEEKISRAVKRKAQQMLKLRAERIARTETVAAQSQGRGDAWRQARDEGFIPEGVTREWVAAGRSVRTCKMCIELNGKTSDFNEPFQSSYVGAVMEPPLHPQCRCVLVLSGIPGADDE